LTLSIDGHSTPPWRVQFWVGASNWFFKQHVVY